LEQTVWLTKEKHTLKPIVKIKLSSYTKCPLLLCLVTLLAHLSSTVMIGSSPPL
jgi:hypothetical protein